MITSNRDFNEWPLVFANPLMASATMDRLVHRAVKIVIKGKSYRSPRRTRNEAESARSTGVSRYQLARRSLTGRWLLPAPAVPWLAHRAISSFGLVRHSAALRSTGVSRYQLARQGPYRPSWRKFSRHRAEVCPEARTPGHIVIPGRPSLSRVAQVGCPPQPTPADVACGHPAVPAVDGSRAALHVIHQAGYVADSYRDKRPEPHGLAGFSRGIDYGLLASSLFVLATFKFTGASLRLFGMDLSQHPFTTGGRRLLFPGVLRDEVFAWAALLAFVLCAAADLIKRGYEVAQRSLNVPKTLHMTLWPPACSSSPRRWRTWT